MDMYALHILTTISMPTESFAPHKVPKKGKNIINLLRLLDPVAIPLSTDVLLNLDFGFKCTEY